MKPRILLSASIKPNIEYTQATEQAGGIPELFYLPRIDTSYDGLILCGGADVDPALYNQPNTASEGIDHERDKVELELFNAFYQAGKPILGICRGHQLINVAMGGDLIQHVDNVNIHRSDKSGEYIEHKATAVKNSFISKLYSESLVINSCHHQAVNTPANGLVPVAFSEHGLIEALEHSSLPIISVQWHPEKTCLSLKKDGVSDGLEIFRYFIELCKHS